MLQWLKDRIGVLLYIALAVVWAASLFAASEVTSRLVNQRRDLAAERSARQQADALAAADQRVLDAERAAAQRISELEASYQEEKDHAIEARDRVIADLRAGNRRLYVNVTTPAGAAAGRAGSGGADQETRAQLSTADGEFLIRFAAEADAVVLELNRCVDRSTVETSMQ